MNVFISYSRSDSSIADDISMRLRKDGDTVFVDRDSLPRGGEFDRRIRTEISTCDFLLFLISPKSIARGSYCRTELRFAKERWPHPEGYILPVIVSPTTFADIPSYLRSVTILEPEGSVVAEVAAEMDRHRGRITKTNRPAVLHPSPDLPILSEVESNVHAALHEKNIRALTRLWAVLSVVAVACFAVWKSIPDKERSLFLERFLNTTSRVCSQDITLVTGHADIGITDRANLVGLPFAKEAATFIEVTSLPPNTRIKRVIRWETAKDKTGQNFGPGDQFLYTVEMTEGPRHLKVAGQSSYNGDAKSFIRVFVEYEPVPAAKHD
ncbi:MAG TPA: toll/interleukin-1 receptor domain-containing protein [Chthoniobacterales bacterium]